jgi:predicted PurR-regulated permease PerM
MIRDDEQRVPAEPGREADAAADEPVSRTQPEGRAKAEIPIPGVAELRRLALAFGFGVTFLVLLCLLIVIYLPVVRPILWATALATLFFPFHRRMYTLLGRRARLAAVASTLLTLAIVAVPTSIFLSAFLNEAQYLWPAVREHLGPDTFQRIAVWLDESPLRPVVPWFFRGQTYLGAETIEAGLREAVSSFGTLAIEQLQEFGKSAPQNAIGVGMTILTYYFFLHHGAGWLVAVKGALPLEPSHTENLVRITGDTVNAVFRGMLATAAVQALLAGVGFAVCGAPAPVVLAGVTLIAALIPFVGPVMVWLPVAGGLVISGRIVAGIGLFFWGTLVVSLVDNFLRPYLIGREIRLPILWLFLAILGGLKAFGFLGVLLGPIVLSLFLACYRIYTEGRRA